MTTGRGQYVHDLRHRYSVELRPDAQLDEAVRSLALQLEHEGLVPAGASTQPRYHPHLTIGRAASTSSGLVEAVATAVASVGDEVEFATAATFGHGRIVYLELADAAVALAARTAMTDHVAADELDPLMTERDWTPHLTIAYSVPDATRAAALEFVRAALPLHGRLASVQTWDLDVRPTQLVHRVERPRTGSA